MPTPVERPRLRDAGALLAGLFVGSLANGLLVSAVGPLFSPTPPPPMDDTAAFAAYIGGLPPLAFVWVIGAHLSQAGLGAWITARLRATAVLRGALIVGGLTAAGCVMNLLQLPGPVWMWAEVPTCLALAALVGRREEARRARLAGG